MSNYDISLFDGIDVFFDALKEKCSTDEEYAAEILKARGFLLEDNELALSDNSHANDALYLNELLTADNLGEVRDGKIFIRPDANVEKIFLSKNISGCEGFSKGISSWETFVHNSYAFKVPLRLLEPFVGRYVKAISACGVGTNSSCDGNHPTRNDFQRILVTFDTPDSLWHELICRRLLAKRFKLRWACGHSIIRFRQADKWRTYIEINRAAEFLYNNRITLRKIRREASNGISNSMAKHLPSEELAEIFSERANKLFDDLFKDV